MKPFQTATTNTTPFEFALYFILEVENGYTEDPDDPGGPTQYGISSRTLKNLGMDIDAKNITIEQAIAIYREYYWNKLGIDNYEIGYAIAIFDTAVHVGVDRTRKWIRISSQSSNPINSLLDLRGVYYLTIIHQNKALRKYKKGWFRRINDLKKYLEVVREFLKEVPSGPVH